MSAMQPITRAALVAILVFWGLCSLFFVQPFTGWFLMVAIPAAIVAGIVFLVLRSRPQAPDEGPGRPRGGPATAAVLIGVLLIMIGLFFAVARWPMLWDPCHTWDDHSTTHVVSPDEPCSSSSSTGQTRTAFILDSLAGEGTLMAGGALAVWCGLRHRRLAVGLLGAAMLLPTVILFRGISMAFIVVFLLGVALVVTALLMRPATSAGPRAEPA